MRPEMTAMLIGTAMTAEFAWGGPVATGLIRQRPEDFRVIEQTGYGPDGDGEHLWVEVEKRELNTLDVARRLAELAGVTLREVGFAGLKDRNAVTVQPFTIQLPGRADPDTADWSDASMQVLSTDRHSRKIQRGRLAGNRFELTVRRIEGDAAGIHARLTTIADHGVPNGFGEQRFGGNNIARAYRLFRGELRRKPSKSKRGFYLSAARSLIFNQVLARRIADATWNRLIDGDEVMLDGTRSTFPADAGDPDQQRRVEQLDLHPTGPMAGRGSGRVGGMAAKIEAEVLADHDELVQGLARFQIDADRRALRMRVLDLDWRQPDPDTLVLAFGLRSGCYATTVLREVLDYTDASHDCD